MLCVACCSLVVVRCSFFDVRFSLLFNLCVLFVVRCFVLLVVVRCLLFVVVVCCLVFRCGLLFFFV